MGLESQPFILLPRSGLRAGIDDSARALLDTLPTTHWRDGPTIGRIEVGEGIPIEIVDSAGQYGPRLVKVGESARDEIRSQAPELRLAPMVEYHRATVQSQVSACRGRGFGQGNWVVTVRGADGAGLPGVSVLAVGDHGNWRGEAVTNAAGAARLAPPLTVDTVSTLRVQPLATYWGAYRTQVSTREPVSLDLTPLDPRTTDALRFYYDQPIFDPSQGVQVGVIDDGVDEHRDLAVAGGQNTVVGEQDRDYSSSSRQGHGTHVAGIVAAAANRSIGVQGVAPRASIRSYRVFPGDGWLATNYSIVKALIAAQRDGCDVVNLSLETSEEDPVVTAAIEDAREHGMVVIAAAGNGGGQKVTQPGSCPGAIAVAAFGRLGTFPADSSAASHVSDIRGFDLAEFVAAFSNCGSDVVCVAPGVGIVSTLPGGRYGVKSGTSMAAPVVTGVAASLLSQSPRILSMSRCRDRARAIERLLAETCQSMGFDRQYEGLGRPRC